MSTTQVEIPNPKAMRDVLLDLLGREVTVKDGTALSPAVNDPIAVAVYVDDRMQTSALLVLDLPLAAWVGASIGLVPKGGAEASIEDKFLSPIIADNCSEVMNIVASVFNTPTSPHVRLYQTYMPGERPPADVHQKLLVLGMRIDLDVEIDGYGKGRLAVIAT